MDLLLRTGKQETKYAVEASVFSSKEEMQTALRQENHAGLLWERKGPILALIFSSRDKR